MRNNLQTLALWTTRFFAHFLLGLDMGLVVFLALIFLFETCLGVKTTSSLLAPTSLGLALPTLFSAGALGLAWWRPMECPKSWNNIALLSMLLPFLFIPWMILMLIGSIAGYC